jgi:hypothetical protein
MMVPPMTNAKAKNLRLRRLAAHVAILHKIFVLLDRIGQ